MTACIVYCTQTWPFDEIGDTSMSAQAVKDTIVPQIDESAAAPSNYTIEYIADTLHGREPRCLSVEWNYGVVDSSNEGFREMDAQSLHRLGALVDAPGAIIGSGVTKRNVQRLGLGVVKEDTLDSIRSVYTKYRCTPPNVPVYTTEGRHLYDPVSTAECTTECTSVHNQIPPPIVSSVHHRMYQCTPPNVPVYTTECRHL
jgi:hypothetical protein